MDILPAKTFARLNENQSLKLTNQSKNKTDETRQMQFAENMANTTSTSSLFAKPDAKQITVCATGEMSLSPDRCKLNISVLSKKETTNDAKESVERRLEYIKQTLHNHNVKESEVSTAKSLQRKDGFYHYEAELHVIFIDPTKCQEVSNYLIEKLDDHVQISMPEFYQSQQRLENFRRQASVLAVSNAKQKAAEIAKFLNASLRGPLAIKEESFDEWDGSYNIVTDANKPMTLQQRKQAATIFVTAKVMATYEFETKNKNKSLTMHK